MIRLVLFLCYASAVLCGPRPCCCATPPPKPAPSPAAGDTCPKCAAKKPKPTPTSPAKKLPCRCPHAELKAVAPPHTADDTRPAFTHDVAVSVSVYTEGPFTLVRAFAPPPPPDPSPHFAHLCHRLRC